jgi:hypothetical protein
MIRPVNFGFNAETAVNNAFQVAGDNINVQGKALEEFDAFVELLRENDVDVLVVDDTPEPHTPDSIFPNNWISFHQSDIVCLFPMFAANRRQERKETVLEAIEKKFKIKKKIDFSQYEDNHLFLEGTGSMVLDRENMIAYACISPRTDKKLLQIFCEQMGYKAVAFEAVDEMGNAIYHTNVMMCVADTYVVICLDALPHKKEREEVTRVIKDSGKEIIEINLKQMNHFAGNMLQIENKKKEKLLVMSTQAYQSLTKKQITKLSSFNRVLHSGLGTIETSGGGSARCMMAEIHLQKK